MTAPAEAPPRAPHSGFINFLLKLAKPGDATPGRGKDLGALAALRASLQDHVGMAARACPYVVPFLPKSADAFEESVFFAVGALFALHPEHVEGSSLGHVFRKINDGTAEGRQGKDNPSTRARFVALLDAHPEDVGEHVRHAVSLARAKGIGIDWNRLLRDLLAWRHHDRWVQRELARDFWRPAPDASPPSLNTETAPESETSR